MDKFKQSFTKLLMLWTTLKGWQKLSILLAGCGIFILLIFIVILGSAPSYDPLYSGLGMDDQGAIVAHLKENRIPYRLESGANAIFVPKNQVHEARLALAQADLPKGGNTGYEIFDNTKMGMSESHHRIAFLRALEGELSRTIERINIVERARVNIVLPEQRLFLEQQDPSSAAIMLTLRSGVQMAPDQVKTVIGIVTKGVRGLLPENVVVVDSHGNTLSDMVDSELFIRGGAGGAISSIQRELERQREKELEITIRNMLERVFGRGNVVVKINVDLNFNKRTSMSKEFIPFSTGRGVLRSQETMEENYTATGAGPGGAPGTTTNIPGYAISPGNVNSEYNKTVNTDNYEIPSVETNDVIAPGSIRRITASVVIDGELEEVRTNDAKVLVASAIGLDESRGDTLVVQSWSFTPDHLMIAFTNEREREKRTSLIIMCSVGIIILLLSSAFAFLWWKRRNAMLAMNRTSQEAKHIPTIQEMLTSPDLIAAQGEISVLEEQLKAYARSNPKEIANLVNEWLTED